MSNDKIKRYGLFKDTLSNQPNGHYVFYSDYESLQSERDRLREAGREMSDCITSYEITGTKTAYNRMIESAGKWNALTRKEGKDGG